MRDLIETQMKMLEELNSEEQELPKDDDKGQRTRDVEFRDNEKDSMQDKYRERRKDERRRDHY
jgi:hypothetical protein